MKTLVGCGCGSAWPVDVVMLLISQGRFVFGADGSPLLELTGLPSL
jgi:hypothetical protein